MNNNPERVLNELKNKVRVGNRQRSNERGAVRVRGGVCVCVCVRASVCMVCVLWWHILHGRRSVVRGAFGGSQAGIKGYGLSHKWNACRMAARMS